jgi:hypothetical protein
MKKNTILNRATMPRYFVASFLLICFVFIITIDRSFAISYDCENIIPVYTTQSSTPTDINYILSDHNAVQSVITNTADFITQNNTTIDKIKKQTPPNNTKLTNIICVQKFVALLISVPAVEPPVEPPITPTPISTIVTTIVNIISPPKLIGSDPRNTGSAAANALLTEQYGFLTPEHLDWTTLCSHAVNKQLPTLLGPNMDYLRSGKAGIEVYTVDVPDDATYDQVFYAVGLSSSSMTPIYSFISDTPCAGTASNVYSYSGGITGTQGVVSSMSYSKGDYYVKVAPGRWYITLLWGSDQHSGSSVYARFFQKLAP